MSGLQVIIVGGGLAGLSAAHTVLQAGGRVLVLDKSPFCGGNSTKATSGINAAGTRAQRALNIPDSPEQFEKDTLASAESGARPDLIHALTFESGPAVEWLVDSFGLDLSVVGLLAAHTHPRTHRGKDGSESFPGMMITYRLMERLDEIVADGTGRARLINKATVTRLLRNGNAVVGVEYEKDGNLFTEHGPVVISTGGFGADFTSNSLLSRVEQQWRTLPAWKDIPLPHLLSLPTTNGPHCTGDGIKLGLEAGARAVDLHAVQVHPTGLVDPREPEAKVKWLAAEALRGAGGVLIDGKGRRFCDELGKRDYVTGRMWKQACPPYRLLLNTAASSQIAWHCEHYTARGLMKSQTGAQLAAEMGIPVSVLEETFAKYNAGAASKKDEFGKRIFPSLPVVASDKFHVAQITPVIHYCMGGLETNPRAEVLGPNGIIPGLYAAGEVVGGVHGNNRLGGSSLCGCVVFGRSAGRSATSHVLASASAPGAQARQSAGSASIASVEQDGVVAKVHVTPGERHMSIDVTWEQKQAPAASASASAPAAAAPAAAPAPAKVLTMDEVAKHTAESDCWVVIDGNVYDVTNFLADHPGGKKAILIYGGKDATREFKMMHKPDIITKYGGKYLLGPVSTGAAAAAPAAAGPAKASNLKDYFNPDTKGLHGSAAQSWNSGGTANELPQERKKATFKVEALTNILDGGADGTTRRRFILAPLDKFEPIDKYNMDRSELMEAHFRDFIAIHFSFTNEGYIPTRKEVIWMSEAATNSGSLMAHFGLFLPTIIGQGSGEQMQWWLPRALNFKMIGSYAQTELGHGSNVRGLQTTAEYDKTTQEFVLNTPTLQSMKWWNSNIGLAATHAAVYAQLILDGVEKGVHVFMVQIRDEEHRPLPGIEIGDVGAKFGDHTIDTGYLRLKNVRIPRKHMLSKRQHVSPDGRYVTASKQKEGNSKAHYATMMQARAGMIQIAGGKLAMASTIAARYSCVRRQGFIEDQQAGTTSFKTKENQIIDYQVQLQVAIAYAIKFSGAWINNRLEGNAMSDEELPEDFVEIHASAAGLKGLCCYIAAEGIEDLRKACGGHGYLLSSGIAALSADYVWQTTAEGDYIVMLLQTARFLVKCVDQARKGETLPDLTTYLADLKNPNFNPEKDGRPRAAKHYKEFFNLDYLVSLFRFRTLICVLDAHSRLQERCKTMSFAKAFNACALCMTATARSHSYYFMLVKFIEIISAIEDPAIKAVMTKLCALFALTNIVEGQQWVGVLDEAQMILVETAVEEVLVALRPDVIPLVDAFDIPDRALRSALGRFDGNVYEALYESAVKCRLNYEQPFRGYKEFLQPHLDMDLLKLHNRPIGTKL